MYSGLPGSPTTVKNETSFSVSEQGQEAGGERARTLVEARRVKATVESMISLLKVMDPGRAGSAVEHHLPYTLDARSRRAMAGELQTVSMQGNTYAFGTLDGDVQVFSVANQGEHKAVHVYPDGRWTYIEERRVLGRRMPLGRSASVGSVR